MSNLGGEERAFSEMLDRVTWLRGFHAPFADLSAGAAGLGACESLFAHRETKRPITEEHLVRHFLGFNEL